MEEKEVTKNITKKCQHCQSEIDIKATVCPYCKRTQLTLGGIILTIIIILAISLTSYLIYSRFIDRETEKNYNRAKNIVDSYRYKY